MSELERMTEPEREVCKFLDELGIWWKYQSPVFLYDEKDRPRIWTPDFFLPALAIYVEVCDSDKYDYDYREKVFDKNVTRIIFVHYFKEEKVWKTYLVQRLCDLQVKRLTQTGSVVQKALEVGLDIQLST